MKKIEIVLMGFDHDVSGNPVAFHFIDNIRSRRRLQFGYAGTGADAYRNAEGDAFRMVGLAACDFEWVKTEGSRSEDRVVLTYHEKEKKNVSSPIS